MGEQSLREIAKELDISPAYLSYMVNGKRPWRKDLYQRYMGVVNTFVNSDGPSVNSTTRKSTPQDGPIRYGNDGAGGGIRTHTPVKVADFKSAASTFPPPRLTYDWEPGQAREKISLKGQNSSFTTGESWWMESPLDPVYRGTAHAVGDEHPVCVPG